jgi:hypothetical protein
MVRKNVENEKCMPPRRERGAEPFCSDLPCGSVAFAVVAERSKKRAATVTWPAHTASLHDVRRAEQIARRQ